MSYRSYESYSQPEVDWLDEMPSHWEIRRTKTMLSLQKSKVGRAASEYTLLSLTLGGVVPRNISEGGKFPAEFDTYQMVEPGDLVFCLFDIDETPRTIGIARDAGMITGAYNVYRALPPCVPEYANYYFLHIDSFKGLRPFYTGLRKVVRADTFSKIEMPAPPLEEQTQIAKFLDYETAKIDALIAKQQQLIALLQEKREGLLHLAIHAKGAENIRLENCCVQINRPIHRTDDEIYYPIGLLNRGRGIFHKEPTLGCDLGDSDFFFIESGDLILSGQFAWEGAVALAGKEEIGCVATHRYPIVRGRSGVIETAFLWAFFVSQTGDFLLNENSRGAAGRNRPLNINSLMKEKIPVPPLEAQRAVAQLVFREVALHKHIQKPIALLQERRTALISAAVTGKIDVRGWQPPPAKAEGATP